MEHINLNSRSSSPELTGYQSRVYCLKRCPLATVEGELLKALPGPSRDNNELLVKLDLKLQTFVLLLAARKGH